MRSPQPSGCGERTANRPAHRQPHVPSTGACASSTSFTTSRLDTRRSIRCEGCCRRCSRVQILLQLAAHRAGIHHRSFHRAQQAVGEPGQCRSRRGLRLHLRAPRAQQQPKQRHRQPRNALCARSAAATHNTAASPIASKHVAGTSHSACVANNPHRKQPCRMKQRYSAQSAAGSSGVVRGGGGAGLHRAFKLESWNSAQPIRSAATGPPSPGETSAETGRPA